MSHHADATSIDDGSWLTRRLLLLMFTTLFALVVFQSAALVTLSYDLPPGFLSGPLVAAAETWHGWMRACGAPQVTETVSQWILYLHDKPLSD